MEMNSKLPWKEIINYFSPKAGTMLVYICAGVMIILCGAFTIKGITIDEITAICICAFLVLVSAIILYIYIEKAKKERGIVTGKNYLYIILFELYFFVVLNAGLLAGNFIGYIFKILLHEKQF